LDSVIIARPSPQKFEQHLCGDKGYDYDDIRLSVDRGQKLSHLDGQN